MIGLKSCHKVIQMDSDRASHQHVLRALSDLAINTKQVGLLESLEPEEVIFKIAREVKLSIDCFIVVDHDFVDFITKERRRSATLVFEVEELVRDLPDASLGPLVQSLDCDAIGQLGVVRVHNCHVGACFCRQIRNFLGRHAYINRLKDKKLVKLSSDWHRSSQCGRL